MNKVNEDRNFCVSMPPKISAAVGESSDAMAAAHARSRTKYCKCEIRTSMLRFRALAETLELRENEPHPMTRLVTLTQFAQRSIKCATGILGNHESLEIEGVVHRIDPMFSRLWSSTAQGVFLATLRKFRRYITRASALGRSSMSGASKDSQNDCRVGDLTRALMCRHGDVTLRHDPHRLQWRARRNRHFVTLASDAACDDPGQTVSSCGP